MKIPSNLPQKNYIKAMWSLEGNSKDRTSGAHDGTDTNITYGTAYGKIKQGASFNGSTSKIVIPDHSDLKPTGNFSISVWFKTLSTGAVQGIFASYNYPNAAGISLRFYNTNKLCFTSGKNTGTTDGTDYKNLFSNTVLTSGTWYHAVIAQDNTKMYIYLNGASDASVNWSYYPVYQANNYVRIGTQCAGGTEDYFFKGNIDEVILWNGVCLNSTEVSALYKISYYDLSEGFFNFF